MEKVVELVSETSKCAVCNKNQYLSWFLVRDVKPWKVMSVVVCDGCGPGQHTSQDFIELDYGVKLFYKSTNLKEFEHRMNFINNHAKVTVFRNGEYLMEFKCENSYVDSMNTLLDRMIELIDSMLANESEEMRNNEKNPLNVVKVKLHKIKEDGVVEIEVVDKSGYSRICVPNIEYTAIEDASIEELNGQDKCIKYEKFEKKKEGLMIPEKVERALLKLKE